MGPGVASAGVAVGKRKEKQRAVSAHRESPYLLMHFRVHHVDQFISRPVAFDLKLRNFVTQILLELVLRAEDQLADF